MDEVPFCSDSDCRVVNKLSAMLKDMSQLEIRGHLTLSARCLQVLYEGFRHIQSSSCIKLSHTDQEEQFFSSLTHLQDIVQSTKELTIFESGETLRGHVDCADFSSITSLEMKCLPLYQLYGLSKVAPNLSKMTCIGCINRIQELLEHCGADAFRASDVLWSKLKEIHLAYNNLQFLDSSLKLVSKLTHFDASHNSLSSTDDHLMVLHNLISLNLSYNSLRTFPEISRSVNRHLTHLNLRNNLITSLKGLSHLFCLQYLDISNNLLTASTTLNNLKALLMLRCLVLAGNPVSFHPSYRRLIIGCLHPAVVSQIKFDGQQLTKKEKQKYDEFQAENLDLVSQLASDFLESVDESISSNCDSLSESLRRSYNKRRPRLVEIVNQDEPWQETNGFQRIENSMEFYDSTRVSSIPSSNCTEHEGERCDSDPRPSKTRASVVSRGNSSGGGGSSRRLKSKLQRIASSQLDSSSRDLETDGFQNNISITGNRLNFVGSEEDKFSDRLDAEVARNVKDDSQLDVTTAVADVNALPETDKIAGASHQLIVDTSSGVLDMSANSDDGPLNSSTIQDDSCLKSDDKLSAEDLVNGASEANTLPDTLPVALPYENIERFAAGVEHIAEEPASRELPINRFADSNQNHFVGRSFSLAISRTHDSLFEDDLYQSLDNCELDPVVWQHFAPESDITDVGSLGAEEVTLDSLMDNGFDGDFLIYLITAGTDKIIDDNRCITSVINNWLYIRTAKEVIERLDLRKLLAVQKVADSFGDYIAKQDATVALDVSFPGPVVRLLFDSFSQKKREWVFSMKTQNQGKQFARLLKSFIKAKTTAKKMQCLRCDFLFDESSGKVANAAVTTADLRRTMKLQGTGDRSVMHCPKCDSHFVIEVSERTGLLSAKNSQTMTTLDQMQSGGEKNPSKHKKRRKNKRPSIHEASPVTQMPTSASLSLSSSFMRRRNTTDQSFLSNDALKLVLDGKTIESDPDDAAAVDAVQFFIDPSEE